MCMSKDHRNGRPAFTPVRRFAWCLSTLLIAAIAPADTGDPAAPSPTIRIPPEATVESLYTDFLHYAQLGRFATAEAYGRALLSHPDLTPVGLLAVANKDRKSLDTLLILIKNDAVGDSASKILDLLERGETERRKDPERIQYNIDELLGGNPQQEYFALKHLAQSGEYAAPHMVQALLDPAKKELWPRVIRGLPSLGKDGVNPLVIALSVANEDVRLHIIHALGEIGYPQAVPYLRKLTVSPAVTEESKAAVAAAIARIESVSGRPTPGEAADLFFQLAEGYYDEDPELRADPRLPEANVWYWDESVQGLKRVPVPTKIFGQVMALRSCEEAMILRNDHTDAIALWLASNIRRESRLGFDTQSGDASESGERDATRPSGFPRALYFTQAAGPRYAHLVLDRAVRDQDSDVALGAIEALRVTAGASSLVGTEDYKQPLVLSLHFPDTLVRIRAALALGAALPRTPFSGSELVVPQLAAALGEPGRGQIVAVDADEGNLNRVMGSLRSNDCEVIGDTKFFRAMDRARTEFASPTAILLSTDISDPDPGEALRRLRGEFAYAKTPVVLLVKERHSVLAEDLAKADRLVELVDARADVGELASAQQRVADRTGKKPIGAEFATSLALETVSTLRNIAESGHSVYSVSAAEPALIAALASSNEQLQTQAASVLALLNSAAAQRAIAHVALDSGTSPPLRLAFIRSLAESARTHGNRLEESQVAQLVNLARIEPDLTLRTAASESLGALNLANNKASEIIRSHYGG